MHLFLNSAELKRLETEGAEIVLRASHKLIVKRYILNFPILILLHTSFIISSMLMYISNFHSRSNYCWKVYEGVNQLCLSVEAEKQLRVNYLRV